MLVLGLRADASVPADVCPRDVHLRPVEQHHTAAAVPGALSVLVLAKHLAGARDYLAEHPVERLMQQHTV